MAHEYVLTRLEAIQQELEIVKEVVSRQAVVSKRRTKMKGLWKGVQVAEDDITEARRSVFKSAFEDDD